MRQNALITGASKRLGKAMAEFLAEKGWNVAIHFNNSVEPAVELSNKLKQQFPDQNFFILQADIRQIDEVLKVIPKCIGEFGMLDLLINNASVFDPGYIKNTTPVLFENQFDVNLKAPFFLIRDFANYCKKGNIINLVDTRVTSNKSNFSAYSLSKKALWELTKMAALELAPAIRVNAIAPGVTLAPEEKDENYLLNLAQKIPMKKPGGVDPILKSLDFILENNHLTGQLIFADGGENLGLNT